MGGYTHPATNAAAASAAAGAPPTPRAQIASSAAAYRRERQHQADAAAVDEPAGERSLIALPSASIPVVNPAIANEPVTSRTNRTTASPLIANGSRVIVTAAISTATLGARRMRASVDPIVRGCQGCRLMDDERLTIRTTASLSAAEARRLALAAQGFADGRTSGEPNGWDLRRVLKRVGLLQIDSVNVLERAHYLPAFSRLGPYPRDLLDRASQRAPRRLFEYWGHEASLLPVELHPLLRWRMERAAGDAWGRNAPIQRPSRALVARVLEQVAERGPVSASEPAEAEPRRSGPWWDWSDAKRAVEWLFWSGQVSTARRRRFERLYDLPERVLPAAALAAPTPPVGDAQRELVRIATRALGVAAERDLRDYFRLPAADAKARVAELVDAGELTPVAVEGWGRTRAYLAAGAGSSARSTPER